jgi:hypothetical protein
MSIQTAFPDAIVFPDGTIRLITAAAKKWAHTKTEVKDTCSADAVPDYDVFTENIPQMMSDYGLVVRREKQPAFHYRSKRRKWPKSTSDGNVIKFLEKIPKSYRQDAMFRAFGRHKARNWRLMQERDEKRQEKLKDEQADQ